MKWTFIILSCFLAIACTKKKEQKYPLYNTFPEEITLKGEVITLDTAVFRYAYRIEVKDSIALVMDLHNTDNFLQAFTYPDFKHITSFGRRGNGPDELLQTNNIRFVSPDSIWTLDGKKAKLYRWSLTPSTGIAQKEAEFSLSKEKLWITDFVLSENNEIYIPDYSGSCSFYTENTQGNIIDTLGILPTTLHPDEPSRQILGQVWTRFIDYNPANGIVALATQLGEVLEIYNLKTDKRIITYGPNDEPVFKLSGNYAYPYGIKGFTNVRILNNLIYAIFEGKTFEEIGKNLREGKTNVQGGRFIYVFDLEGKPVRKYTLDHPIMDFYIDEANKKIIALDINNDEPIVQFNL
ncbi:BF3164 family lipoprotein [Parabacteroides pacaensis]|uniref:BF3164 family lipoprotein n=1 Tax=Parabacteroides pacaensis TaxID=2086575 RepID=UPI000D0E3C4D|nr:BF3164 family lipoprotein [Parabacteroides pacaensis]